ncbi:hypothetical protein [Novosphingobium sediminicola]|nr:hypothetical protein [Novosphingobium sediminicola]
MADEEWNGDAVRGWLERRIAASQTDQVRAERAGRDYEDDYDKAAAEEWVCRQAWRHPSTGDQAEFGKYLKSVLDRDEYSRTGVYSERRFEREVKTCLRKLMKMAKANEGFANTSHFQKG